MTSRAARPEPTPYLTNLMRKGRDPAEREAVRPKVAKSPLLCVSASLREENPHLGSRDSFKFQVGRSVDEIKLQAVRQSCARRGSKRIQQ